MIKPNVSLVCGLVFVTESGDEYGTVREPAPLERHPVTAIGLEHLADDDSGNAFARKADGGIVFWDHETNDVINLAPHWSAFVAGCAAPSPGDLDKKNVRSAWIDPDFAQAQGLDAPRDGWLKKPTQ